MMKIILLDDVEGVGKRGEAHDVRDGFGRNFLVPRGFAIPATRGNIKKVQEQARFIVGKREKNVETAEAVKRRLDEAPPVIIKKKAGVDGKLFGSVTAKDVAEAVKKALDLDVDRRALRLAEPLKMTGAYTVEARLEKGIVAQVRLEIEEE
jgi:large subunit ribosomal protein L9